MPQSRTILHPTDLSPHSDYALRLAESLVKDNGDRLIVLHVLEGREPPDWLSERMAGCFPWTDDCHRVLEERVRPIRERTGGPRVEVRVDEGVPEDRILQMAEAESCDFIVMGTHGNTGLENALLGSVAETVARNARCPVLSVIDPRFGRAPNCSVTGLRAKTTAKHE
jgi:nucleotide-binding universal stress UspA family protein